MLDLHAKVTRSRSLLNRVRDSSIDPRERKLSLSLNPAHKRLNEGLAVLQKSGYVLFDLVEIGRRMNQRIHRTRPDFRFHDNSLRI